MHRVGDVVGPVHDLRFQRRPAIRGAGAHPVGDLGVVGVEAELAAAGRAPPRVFRHRVQRRPGEIQPDADPLGIKDFRLQSGEDPEVLGVALEAAARGGELVESTFAVVAIGRMADVVGQSGHIHQVGIAAERDRHAAADLGDFQRVGEPGARVVALPGTDHLRLIRQSAEGRAVQHPGPVAGEVAAVLRGRPGQRGGFGRFGHDALPVGLVVAAGPGGPGKSGSHRRTVCQYAEGDRGGVLLAPDPAGVRGLLHWRSCASPVCSA